MSNTVIKAENVSKKFCRNLKISLWYGVQDVCSELFGAVKNSQLNKEEFWAVDEVNFKTRCQ
jgi:lipopolysaccharide transport system ATP-binding protein